MRISEKWLRSWVNPPLDGAQLAEQLTMAGLEVDQIDAAAAFNQVVVGRVTELAPHPQADQLQVAQVDVGQATPLQIVCGAPNVAIGMHAPTALVGAKLPELEVQAATLRGVESQGMLCSAKELGLGEDAAGLMVLANDSTVGQNLYQLLDLDDQIIEVDLTPNRGDCLGMVGIAREIGVLNRCPVTAVDCQPVAATIDARFPVTLSDPADCARFVGRVIKNINPLANSPLWLTERLRRAGIRSLGPVVDITNYIMLELNHPMHAYDLNKLSQGIDVRRARPGERLTLLNEQRVEPDAATLLITDGSGPIGLAGYYGRRNN